MNSAATDVQTFDYVIVGAGAAGGVLASKLSEDPNVTVCVLEAGPPDRHPMIHIPAGFTKIYANSAYTWTFETEPTPQTAGRSVHLVQGKTLGGSTSVNGMVFVRAQRGDFDKWPKAGNSGWSYAEVLPYFKALETRLNGNPEWRGRTGPMNIGDVRWRDPACNAFIEAAIENGMPLNPDYNGSVQKGVSFTQTAIAKRRRISSATAFLHPAMKRPNLRVVTEALANRILFQGKRATGIQYTRGDQSFVAVARKEVIISAGTINTARLLQVSGVGDPELLSQLGVPVVNPLKGVGSNFQDHYLCSVVAAGKNFVSINQLGIGPRLWWQIARYFLGAKSILELPPPLIHWFLNSKGDEGDADIQGVFSPASNNLGQSGKLDTSAGMTGAFWQHRPQSKGYVKAVSTRIADAPIVQPNYLQHETDRAVVLAGYRMMRLLLGSRALSPFVKAETSPGADIQTDDELLDFAARTGGTAYHFTGTAKMGLADDPTSVVDTQLRVHGMTGLRVADASIIPHMISGNTQATTLMIGLKAADLIRNQ